MEIFFSSLNDVFCVFLVSLCGISSLLTLYIISSLLKGPGWTKTVKEEGTCPQEAHEVQKEGSTKLLGSQCKVQTR